MNGTNVPLVGNSRQEAEDGAHKDDLLQTLLTGVPFLGMIQRIHGGGYSVLLDHLIARQAALKKSNTEFAALLGISFGLWYSVRTGRRVINRTILEATVQHFPDLKEQVLFYLKTGGMDLPESDTVDDKSAADLVGAAE